MKKSVLFLLFILSFSSFSLAGVPLITTQAQSQSSSCAQNSLLTIAMDGGGPNSFNGINTFTTTGGFTEGLSYLSLYPPPSVGGAPDYQESIVDWYHSNSNYTQWTFNVRPGLKWSDGTNVSSRDIVNTFSPQFALNSSSDVQGLHLEITRVIPLNSSAAEFVLNISDAHLPEKLSGIIYSNVMPKSFISQGTFFEGFGGTYPADGPFVIDNYSSGSPQAVLTVNPYFTPHPSVCKIVVDYVEDQSEVSTLLQAGTADLGLFVPYNDISNLLKYSSSLHLLDQKNLFVSRVSYNDTIYPYNMTAFRQALVYGINQSQIIQQAFAGYASNAYNSEGGVPPTFSSYSSNQSSYSYNPSKALQLLSTIGISKDSKGKLTYLNGTEISLGLWAKSDYSADVESQSIIQQNLDSLGFNIILDPATLESNLIGDTYANSNGIDSAMIIDTEEACDFGMPYLDALPAWQVCIPLAAPPTWLEPPSAQAQYQANLTALQSTANSTLIQKDLANIQNLNSQFLPVLIFNYADPPIVYNSQRWTNWPTGSILKGYGNSLNNTDIALLQPVSAATSSASSASISSSTASGGSSATTSGLSSSSTSSSAQSSSSSNASSLNSSFLYFEIAVVFGVAVASAVGYVGKRQMR